MAVKPESASRKISRPGLMCTTDWMKLAYSTQSENRKCADELVFVITNTAYYVVSLSRFVCLFISSFSDFWKITFLYLATRPCSPSTLPGNGRRRPHRVHKSLRYAAFMCRATQSKRRVSWQSLASGHPSTVKQLICLARKLFSE